MPIFKSSSPSDAAAAQPPAKRQKLNHDHDNSNEDEVLKEIERNAKKDANAITPFQRQVYLALLKVPKGKVTTYNLIAKYLNSSPRAVGNALRTNPYAPQVPCHRVIKADLSIGGFRGSTGACADINDKIQLLKEEGVIVDGKTFYLQNSDSSLFTYH